MLNSYKDPFVQLIDYTPTGKDAIDRGLASARRLLSPHTAVLHMLLSRLQAARYRRPNVMFLIQHLVMRSARSHGAFRYYSTASQIILSELTLQSTHALAREPRFAFLSFGMETIRSSYLDSFCENLLRESLYTVAYDWFATRPQ